MSEAPMRPHVPYIPNGSAEDEARSFADRIALRRTVRDFSPEPVPRSIIEAAVRAAGSAPSGANKQPWRFVCVADPKMKHRIRVAAEEEERAFYEGRASEEWLNDLRPFATTADKGFLEVAPWLIVVFALTRADDGGKTYYVNESVGLATGMLLTALHLAGVATLTHTPSPMRFLREVLGRPATERPYMLIVAGWPAQDCVVPDIRRKSIDDIAVFVEGPESD